jgi:hypothetical protein
VVVVLCNVGETGYLVWLLLQPVSKFGISLYILPFSSRQRCILTAVRVSLLLCLDWRPSNLERAPRHTENLYWEIINGSSSFYAPICLRNQIGVDEQIA